MEGWNGGMMKYGIMEYWNIGMMGRKKGHVFSHYSIIPLFQHSNLFPS
jgi:hypothetical protein